MISIKKKHAYLIIDFCLISILFSGGYAQNIDLKEIRKPVQNGVEDIIKTYLDAINSGSREKVLSFIHEHYDPSFLQQVPLHINLSIHMANFYKTAGLRYELHSVRLNDNNEYIASIYNNLTAAWLTLQIPISPAPPHKIVMFPDIQPTSPPPDIEFQKRLNDQEIIRRLELCLDSAVKDDEFSGAVLVAKNGIPLFKKAYGLASKSYNIKNRLDTKFNIASLGKMFTGAAITQLTQKGELLPNDPLNKYVDDEWIKLEISKKIQIQHLLTHTSGLGDYFKSLYTQLSPMVFRGLEDYQSLVANQDLTFEPGERWAYSNTGMLLLGVVVEHISGDSYYDYVRKHIFVPAGMINSDYFEKDRPVSNRATGYIKELTDSGVRWQNNRFTRVMKGGPSGGSYSTVEDLLNFDIALRNHKLLDPKYARMMLSAKPELNSPFYGYGFYINESPVGRIASHGGDSSGISCQYKMYLDIGYTTIILSNYNVPAAGLVEEVIHQMIVSHRVTATQKTK
jgi:CubicO group peptidase (beta-lactamase class C family)